MPSLTDDSRAEPDRRSYDPGKESLRSDSIRDHGAALAVTDIVRGEPYSEETNGIEPAKAIPDAEQPDFDCSRMEPRDLRETKGANYKISKSVGASCC